MITLSQVSKNYGNIEVLSDINLTINKGEIYGLIGKNGAGKTTIFKIMLGLTSYNSGTLKISNSNTKKDLQEMRKKIGFFIGKNFFDYLNAEDNLHYYRLLKGIKNKQEVDRVLQLVGLKNVKVKYSAFSMGMKQRLGIANALLGNPEILILDEPANGLDPQGIADIRNLIIELNKNENMTIIVSSHILAELEHTANVFGIVHEGKVIKQIKRTDLQETSSTIEVSVNNLQKAQDILERSDIPILKATTTYKSLEDYYFELVGEENHV